MSDLISREEALERLRNIPADLGRRELDDAIKAVEDVPSEGKAANTITIEVSPEQIKKCVKNAIADIVPFARQWIPCSERLPEDGTYLCWEWQGFCYVDSFKDGNWETAEKCHTKCIAWMPLPEPYREEEVSD